MPRIASMRSPRQRRKASVLPLFTLLLPVLVGILGLVIDTGLLLASHRQAQNAADASALAAALRLLRGESRSQLQSDVETFVGVHNGLRQASVTVAVGSEVTHGPYAGNPRCVEVNVTYVVTTAFMRVLGPESSTVSARAVAVVEPLPTPEGLILLNGSTVPGLHVRENATLTVNGSLVVNSPGRGVDQYGQAVDWGYPASAIATGSRSVIAADHVQVRGGVEDASVFRSRTPGGANPLFSGAGSAADPLAALPVPSPSNTPSINSWSRKPAVTANGHDTVVLNPGVYRDIDISGNAQVTFNPGVYVISPLDSGAGLRIRGNAEVNGTGVLFYLTGSSYLLGRPGYYDELDGPVDADPSRAWLSPAPDPNPDSMHFAGLEINLNRNGRVNLSGLSESNSPFQDMVVYQRRRNTRSAELEGAISLSGTMYAKWANVRLGQGSYRAQLIVGSVTVPSGDTVTVGGGGEARATAFKAYLVE